MSEGAMSDWWTDDNSNLGLSDCKAICLEDCSCTACATAKVDGTGCKFSRGQFDPYHDPQVLYLRVSTSQVVDPPLGHPTRRKHLIGRHLWFIIGSSVLCFILVIFVFTIRSTLLRLCCFLGKRRSIEKLVVHEGGDDRIGLTEERDHDLPFYSLSCVEMATDHFSLANKLGQGGFGTVYKGKLVDGQEIAVKRLSKRSGQGLHEFKNEIILISKLQHKNLVKLLGCCVEGEEKILIYEYMPNKSLDSFLFDATKQALLDWKLHVCIIEGIAQGLLYLHKYSRLSIIHRDLKTSNILLDENMNPKISDFGLARIFSGNESPASTKRIVGTYGYMSPEYAMNGIFSVKSDVFSFGVMMLEIISGKKNNSFFQHDRPLNLLGHAWDLWKERRESEVMDPALVESTNELAWFVQVGLLCVQENARDRPTMSNVVSMISNKVSTLPDPKQPAGFSSLNDCNLREYSINRVTEQATITELEPR